MNETMSLLLATAILAAGGLGLYMYKSGDDNNQKGGEDYNEDSLFGSGSFWDSNTEDELIDDEVIDEEYTPKSKAKGGKTKRNRKSGGTKRRY